jgi:hypothetical protein
MSCNVLILLSCVAITAVSFAQAVPTATPPAGTTVSAPTSDPRDRVAEGMVIVAELWKSLDAKKIKAGDSIEARTAMDLLAHGEVLIPRNAKIIGHATEVKTPSKASPGASVGIAFDRVSIKGEREVVLQAVIQAIGPPLVNPALADVGSANEPGTIPPASSSPQSNDIMHGIGLPSRGSGSYPEETAGSSSGVGSRLPSTPALGSKSQGVVGLKGLLLKTEGGTSSVSSEKGNVHLDGGTQLVLRAQ